MTQNLSLSDCLSAAVRDADAIYSLVRLPSLPPITDFLPSAAAPSFSLRSELAHRVGRRVAVRWAQDGAGEQLEGWVSAFDGDDVLVIACDDGSAVTVSLARNTWTVEMPVAVPPAKRTRRPSTRLTELREAEGYRSAVRRRRVFDEIEEEEDDAAAAVHPEEAADLAGLSTGQAHVMGSRGGASGTKRRAVQRERARELDSVLAKREPSPPRPVPPAPTMLVVPKMRPVTAAAGVVVAVPDSSGGVSAISD